MTNIFLYELNHNILFEEDNYQDPSTFQDNSSSGNDSGQPEMPPDQTSSQPEGMPASDGNQPPQDPSVSPAPQSVPEETTSEEVKKQMNAFKKYDLLLKAMELQNYLKKNNLLNTQLNTVIKFSTYLKYETMHKMLNLIANDVEKELKLLKSIKNK